MTRMTRNGRRVGIWIVGLLVSAHALSASAAGFVHCPDPDNPDDCYTLPLEEVPFPIDPDPGPYTPFDVGPIAGDLARVLGVSAEPDPEPWLFFDMENRRIAVLDLRRGTLYAPEPASIALLATGGLALAALARRRRRGEG